MKVLFSTLFICIVSCVSAQTLQVRDCNVLYNYQQNFVNIVYPAGKLTDLTITADSAEVTRYDDTTCTVWPRVKGHTLTLFMKTKKGKVTAVKVTVKITKKPVAVIVGAGCGSDVPCVQKEGQVNFSTYTPSLSINFPTDCNNGIAKQYSDPPISAEISINGKTFDYDERYSEKAMKEFKQFKKGKIVFTNILTKWNNTDYRIPKVELIVK